MFGKWGWRNYAGSPASDKRLYGQVTPLTESGASLNVEKTYPYRVKLSVWRSRPRTTILRPFKHGSRVSGPPHSQRPRLMAAGTWELTSREMLAVIAALTRRNFYKSMTTHADHRIWQDVYYSPTPVDQEAYIKITMRDAAPVIQFKEK